MIVARHEAESPETFASPAPIPKVSSAARVFLMIQTLETGGSERQFAALAKALAPTNFQPLLGCIRKRGDFLPELGDIPEFPLLGSLYGWQAMKSRLTLSRHLTRSGVAICHSFDFYSNLAAIPAARFAGVPVVIGSQRQIGDQLRSMQSRAQNLAFRLCDRVICNSKAAARRLAQDGIPDERLVVIGNGLHAEAFAAAAPVLPVRPDVLRVGMIARMNALYKNHRDFIEMAALLSPRLPKVEFVLVGDGPLRAELERHARDLGIANKILFLGNRRDIPAILASLDISVLASQTESLSNVVMESMAAGVPVVACDVGGNPELVSNETGLLVPPNDPESLAEAISKLLSDPDSRIELGRNAKRHAQENFTIDRMRSRHEELYEELLARKDWRPKARVRPLSAAKTRVAIVAASSRYVGGQSVQADLLLRHWENDSSIAADFIAIDPPLSPWLRWAERIPFLRTGLREPFYLWSLWRAVKVADIVHIFSASYWAFLIATVPAWMIARLRGKRTLVHYHSGEARDHLRSFRTARPLLKRMGPIVVPSRYLVQVFREFGLSASAIPNIVDLSEFRYRPRPTIRPHFLCTRGFHPYYGIDIVVRAFAEIKKALPEARLDLVGQGQLESKSRRLVEELKLTDVNFLGVIPHHQIHEYYSRADIFINASCLDNMPVSILEAYAAGTPVVTTSPEGMHYLVDHDQTGLLSDVGDFVALARNALRLFKEPGLASRLSQNARERLQDSSWPAVREEWLNLYNALSDTRKSFNMPLKTAN